MWTHANLKYIPRITDSQYTNWTFPKTSWWYKTTWITEIDFTKLICTDKNAKNVPLNYFSTNSICAIYIFKIITSNNLIGYTKF